MIAARRSQHVPIGRALRHTRLATIAAIFAMLALLTPLSVTAAPASPRADSTSTERDAFQRTWARTDAPVADGSVARTWMWGPTPLGEPTQEPYAESPGGVRTVVYYDKSRMEVTHPDAVDDGLWYVTNGLLVRELITGQIQIGDNLWDERLPAEINIVGDQGADGITYAAVTGFTTPAGAIGDTINAVIDADGRVLSSNISELYDVRIAAVSNVRGAPSHGIAGPFWEFMTARGPVSVDGVLIGDTLFQNPYYATGFPLTEPFWTRATVGGTPKDVLFQCFERRCLTYTPGNPDGWQVESGNVGQHYQQWRNARPPHVSGEILVSRFLWNRPSEAEKGLFLISADGTQERQLVPDFRRNIETPLWSPDGTRIAFTNYGDIYIIDVEHDTVQRITETLILQEAGIAWSPNSEYLVFSRWGTEQPEQLFIRTLADGTETQLTGLTPETQLEASGSPVWSPDGEWIAYTTLRQGTFGHGISVIRPDGSQTRELMPASGPDITDLAWTADSRTVVFHMPVTAGRDASGGSLWSVDAAIGVVTLELLAGCSTIGRGCADGGTSYAPSAGVPAPSDDLIALAVSRTYDAPISPGHGTQGAHGISLLDPMTGEIDQIIHAGSEAPSWSPDSSYLTFHHLRRDSIGGEWTSCIGVTSRDGSMTWTLTCDGHDPQWRPTATNSTAP